MDDKLIHVHRLTHDAQGALRRVMEIYSTSTRFALCCNYVSRIIDPVASRCSKFRFKALEGGQAVARVEEILKAENVRYDEGVIERTLKVSDGDLRRAINLLQSAARLAGASASSSTSNGHKKNVIPDDDDEDEEMVDADANTSKSKSTSTSIRISDINEIAGTFPPSWTDSLIMILQKGASQNFTNIQKEITDIVAAGYAATEVMNALFQKIISNDEDDVVGGRGKADAVLRKKYQITEVLSNADMRFVAGADEHLGLLDLSCQIAGILAA